MEIKILPGAFDNFEGTQEELEEFMKEIQRMVDSGELFQNAQPLTEEEFNELPEEVQEQIAKSLELESDDEQEEEKPTAGTKPGRLLH